RRRSAWIIVALASVLASSGLMTPSASATASFGPGSAAWDAYYANPSDKTTWDAFCRGGGGTYAADADGAPACGPLGSTTIGFPGPGGSTSSGFQCVELVKRYLYVTRNWAVLAGTNGSQVVSNYGANNNVAVIANSTPGKAPTVGTVMSFYNNADRS